MAKLTLEYLDWDSKQLGVPCGLIDGTRLKIIPRDTVLVDQIKALYEKRKDLEFITIKLPSNCREVANALIKMGAILIDAELTFTYLKGAALGYFKPVPNNLKFVFCKECDSKAFIPLATEMRLSRFFIDPKIPRDKALRLWQASIKNHCEGFADQLLIAYYNDEPCAMITLKFKDHKRIFLHIVGVLKKFQGRNIGRLMLRKITGRYGKGYVIYVETQSNNISAQSIYQDSGFKFHSLKYVLHYWRQ